MYLRPAYRKNAPPPKTGRRRKTQPLKKYQTIFSHTEELGWAMYMEAQHRKITMSALINGIIEGELSLSPQARILAGAFIHGTYPFNKSKKKDAPKLRIVK